MLPESHPTRIFVSLLHGLDSDTLSVATRLLHAASMADRQNTAKSHKLALHRLCLKYLQDLEFESEPWLSAQARAVVYHTSLSDGARRARVLGAPATTIPGTRAILSGGSHE
jgi:hypothetical protein